MKHLWMVVLFVVLSGGALSAQSQGVLGLWTEPAGSTIEIYRCDQAVCARLVAISPQTPTKLDGKNPDSKLRTNPLCGLVIGQGFQLSDPEHAEGGHLYDPKSGKTYRGSMTGSGNQLQLRGYMGVKLFGRSETWTRAKQGIARCKP